LTAFTIGGASELATMFTIRTTFLPWARIDWIWEISVCELPCESTILSGTPSFSDSALEPSIIEAMYGLVVLITEATRTRSSFLIGCCWPPAAAIRRRNFPCAMPTPS
jgi:hypothetical protein